MDLAIARWRLRNQHLVAPHAASACAVLETLLAVQAENPSQSAWAVAARTAAPDPGPLAGLLDSGAVLRTHVLRPTWHYVARADIDWLLALTAPRVLKSVDLQLRESAGLSTRDVDRLGSAVVDLLASTPNRTRDEIAAALREHAPVDGRAVMALMAHLELRRLVISGSPRDGEHTYATYADRVGAREVDRADALARLALRYFTGHGPATVKDLAYWATLTLTDVRAGLDAVRDQLDSFEHGGRTYWHAPGEPPDRAGEPGAHLLQLLDETYRGYQDSRWVLDAAGVVPRGREAAIGMALVDAQLVAGMKRTVTATQVVFELTPHRALSGAERQALAEAADRYGAFLDRPAVLRVAG
ncbi:winged helix DNA-binding domain-containing protein [Actinokineospora sp. NPDC004072]